MVKTITSTIILATLIFANTNISFDLPEGGNTRVETIKYPIC